MSLCKYDGCSKSAWNNLDSAYCKEHTFGQYCPSTHNEDGTKKPPEPTIETLTACINKAIEESEGHGVGCSPEYLFNCIESIRSILKDES